MVSDANWTEGRTILAERVKNLTTGAIIEATKNRQMRKGFMILLCADS
jgi:hypothetical protein